MTYNVSLGEALKLFSLTAVGLILGLLTLKSDVTR